MSDNQGYSITTWRFRLCCKHPEWLRQTEEFFNQIQQFYYDLFLKHPQLSTLASQKILRELEILSIPGRDKKLVETPLPWERIPLYFRRAAANAGIAAAKSHLARNESYPSRQAQEFNSAAVYYKGMYRDFSSSEITLKVWDGIHWRWMRCRLYGNEFPVDAQLMSPSVVFAEKLIMLHVPVKEIVCDTSTVKKRMQDGRNLCSLQFINGDSFAVGTILDSHGKELAVKFWGGGKEYSHRCQELLKKIEKSKKSLGAIQPGHPNQKYWMHLKHLSEFYAHQISSEIVHFCMEYKAGVIALPKYNEIYTRHVMKGSGDWSPLHLSGRIRRYVSYKAWKAGIITIEVHAEGISTFCAICGKKVILTDKKINEFVCADGHKGNRHLNAARNLGGKCLRQFGRYME